jgi:hypothetical protein
VQRVASHRSLVVLDDEPAVSDSKEVANQTDSTTYDIDKRAYNKGTVITNELYIDIKDLRLGVKWPQLNSPKTKETS